MSKYEANAASQSDAPPQYPASGHLPSQGQGAPPSNQGYYNAQQPQTQQYGQYASGAPQSQQFGGPPNQPYGAPPPLQQHPSNGSMYPPQPGSGLPPAGPTMVGATGPGGSSGSFYGAPQQGPPQQWQQPNMGTNPYMQGPGSGQGQYGYQQNQQNNSSGAGAIAKGAGGSCLATCLGCAAALCCLDILF